MTPRRIPILLALVLCAACATSKGAILARTQGGLDAAHASFLEYDQARQVEIVEAAEAAPTRDQALAEKAKLVEHRKVTRKIRAGFVAAYGAIAAAALEPSDLNMSRAVQLAIQAIAALKGWTP